MSEAKVYYKPIKTSCKEEVNDSAAKVFQRLIEDENWSFEPEVPIKVHFGEKGNVTFVPPQCYDGIINILLDHDCTSAFIETNVLYRGARTTRESHTALALEHGFTKLPIIIADGDHGEDFQEIVINKEHFGSCKIGSGFSNYDQIIVCSHFKGHGAAGFGGAVKQLSMGFAARGGKMAQHAKMVPSVSKTKCIACGLCVQKCDVHAISIDKTANIDEKLCVGCAGCIAVCPVGAIRNDWNGENFKEKIAEYAYAAQLNKRFIYVNFLINITAECDCMGSHMEPVAADIGVLASLDPIAIDRACFDLLNKNHHNESHKPLFEEGLVQLIHGQKIGLGTQNYQLIEM